MNKLFYFLFPLNESWCLGGDEASLLLLKYRTFSIEGATPPGGSSWFPVERCGETVTAVIDAINAKGIQLTDEAASELKAMPERFWDIPRTVWHGAEW